MVLSPVQIPDAPVETVLARLKGVRTSLHGWVACCPAHIDREPSLSIGLGDEGQVLLNCFAGCSLDSIVEAMGITLAELFPVAASESGSRPEQTQHNVSPSLISHRTNCCIGSTSYTWGSPSNERVASRSPITCPMALRRLDTGCARHWSRKRDHTGAKGQAR
jgi:hypothetical protein